MRRQSNQKRHERRTKHRQGKKKEGIQNISLQRNLVNESTFNTKIIIDPWEWFANFLCINYKFDAKVIFDTKNSSEHSYFGKAILVKTFFPEFSIMITNKQYLYGYYITMHYYFKKNNNTIGTACWTYDTFGEDRVGYETTETDKIMNSIFEMDNFGNCFIANKIIERIYHDLELSTFCQFIHRIGNMMIMGNKLASSFPQHEEDQGTCNQNVVCFNKYNELLKECKRTPYMCYDFKLLYNAFEEMRNVLLENIPLIKEIRNVVIDYYFG
jgi:hypothetical protein